MAVTGIWTSAEAADVKHAPGAGVKIWHSKSRRLLAHLPHRNLPRGACWDRQGRTLISGTVDGRIKWSRLSSEGKLVSTAESPTPLGMVTALASGADGLLAAGDSKGQILLFRIDGDQFEEVLAFQGHPSLIRTLEFHSETGALFSGDGGRQGSTLGSQGSERVPAASPREIAHPLRLLGPKHRQQLSQLDIHLFLASYGLRYLVAERLT